MAGSCPPALPLRSAISGLSYLELVASPRAKMEAT